MVLYTMKLESNWMDSRWMERILWNFKDRIRSNRKKNYQLQFSKVKKNSVDGRSSSVAVHRSNRKS